VLLDQPDLLEKQNTLSDLQVLLAHKAMPALKETREMQVHQALMASPDLKEIRVLMGHQDLKD
jgi:hypothetical protein